MPPILDSEMYKVMENDLHTLFHDIYKHNKKNRDEFFLQANDFLDNLSDCITDHSRLLFTKISPEEILYFKDNKSEKSREKFQNIDEMINYFNNLSMLINFSVLQQEDPTLRVFYYDMYIQLMNFCYLKGDFFAANAIYSGLVATNLSDTIDWKQLSRQSRLIWDERETDFNRLCSPGTSYNTYVELSKKFKTPLIPVLQSFLGMQVYAKQAYDFFVDEHKRIQAKLHELDMEIHRVLNDIQRETTSWSQDYYKYMKDVYLPQSIFEYTKLIQEYEALLSEHGGPIAKQFHKDENAKQLVALVESTLLENQSVLEVFPQNEKIVGMLQEIETIKSKYTELEEFEDMPWQLKKTNCTSVKAKPVGKYTSEVFAKFAMPQMEENTDTDESPIPVVSKLRKKDTYHLPSRVKLMLELEQAIEDHKPKKVKAGSGNHGFFKRQEARNSEVMEQEDLGSEVMEIGVIDVDVIDHDEDDLQYGTSMVN
ncbi:RasGEF domain-containing protein [Legionella feeleii]|uniref:Ras GEF n=1 Tax=Legionella feeleii TaxID=453 RepID=A0A0W0UAJ9_9GAMM|nr:RasGEF domain-containing protein [Legionella feeleii]KTD04647.1 Ras GEF [Legionella feeleii]SPX59482.1 Ras GEF [Legionella feeleii]